GGVLLLVLRHPGNGFFQRVRWAVVGHSCLVFQSVGAHYDRIREFGRYDVALDRGVAMHVKPARSDVAFLQKFRQGSAPPRLTRLSADAVCSNDATKWLQKKFFMLVFCHPLMTSRADGPHGLQLVG